jgi:hypothetical protein
MHPSRTLDVRFLEVIGNGKYFVVNKAEQLVDFNLRLPDIVQQRAQKTDCCFRRRPSHLALPSENAIMTPVSGSTRASPGD